MSDAGPSSADALLGAARAGDGAALGQLLERYRHYLALLARIQIGRRLQRKVDEADLVQETFLEAHRAFPRFRGAAEPEFVAWLREILGARLAMQLRQFYGAQKRDLVRERDLVEELNQSSLFINQAFVASGTSPSMKVERREQAVVLADALAQLSDDHRQALTLRHLDGLTFPEIAERIGRSTDAAEKLWARALIQLRRTLPQEE
jgi:RNA polymerase sigma-70 factor (ECF subfamily)